MARTADVTTTGRERKPGTGSTRSTVRGQAMWPTTTPAPSTTAASALRSTAASQRGQRRRVAAKAPVRLSDAPVLALGASSMLSAAEPLSGGGRASRLAPRLRQRCWGLMRVRPCPLGSNAERG